MSNRHRTDNTDKFQDDPDQIFLTINTNYSSYDPNDSSPQIAQTIVNRNGPILNHMENFYCTVMRMSYAAYTVPIMIAPLQVNTDYSQNLTIYGITLTYLNFTSGIKYVIWETANEWATQPTGNVNTSLQSSNPYYYAFNYVNVCRMINTTFQTAFTALDNASGNTLPAGSVAPKFKWDSARQSPVLQAQEANYDVYNSINPITIWFNNTAANLFCGFDFTIVNNNNLAGLTHYFNITNEFNNLDPVNNTLIDTYPIRFNPAYWSCVDTVQLNTSLPIVYEQITPPSASYGKFPTVGMGNTTDLVNPQSNIIFDSQPDWSSVESFQTLFIYNKTDSTRYLEMAGTGALTSFSLNYTFTLYDGTVVPLYLINNTNCIVKLAFIKKSLINSRSTQIVNLLKEEKILNEKRK